MGRGEASTRGGRTISRTISTALRTSTKNSDMFRGASGVVKCLWEVFVWGFGVLFLSCVSVSGVLFSVGVRV